MVSTQEHRKALLSNLAAALFTHGRIQTTLAKAKGLRPFAEKIITLGKKASLTKDKATAIHLKRTALTYVRDEDAVTKLFSDRIKEFASRDGGYTRIYKLGRRGSDDSAEMALIELISASDEGFKSRSKRKAAAAKPAPKAEVVEAKAEAAKSEEKPAAKKAASKSEKASEEKPAKKAPAKKPAAKKADGKKE